MCKIVIVELYLHNRLFAHEIVLEILYLNYSYSVWYKKIGFTMMDRPWMISYDVKRFYYADHIIGTEYDEIIFIL